MRILGIVILIAGLVLFWQYQYIPALISILIGAVFLGKPKKPVSDKTSQDDNPEDGEIVRVDSQLKKVRAVSTEHRRLAFPVDGVAENNDDGRCAVKSRRGLVAPDPCVEFLHVSDFFFTLHGDDDRGLQSFARRSVGARGKYHIKFVFFDLFCRVVLSARPSRHKIF